MPDKPSSCTSGSSMPTVWRAAIAVDGARLPRNRSMSKPLRSAVSSVVIPGRLVPGRNRERNGAGAAYSVQDGAIDDRGSVISDQRIKPSPRSGRDQLGIVRGKVAERRRARVCATYALAAANSDRRRSEMLSAFDLRGDLSNHLGIIISAAAPWAWRPSFRSMAACTNACGACVTVAAPKRKGIRSATGRS